MTQRNRAGHEVWDSTHINGELRPELRGLSRDETIKTFVDHWPDLTEEQLGRLAALLHPGA